MIIRSLALSLSCLLWLVALPSCHRGDSGSGRPSPTRAGDGGEGAHPGPGLQALAAEEFAAELSFSPTTATWLGDHRFDDRLDDVRQPTVAREIARLRALRARVVALSAADLKQEETAALDRRLLLARIDDRLFELDELRPHERNPLFYMNLIAFGLDGLLQPDFVPTEGRVRALASRLRAIAPLCREAQRNLKNPPELLTRRAQDLGAMTRTFLQALLPRLMRGVADPKLVDEFNRDHEEAKRALDDFLTWLGRDLLPRAKGEWALGQARLAARLQAAELLDVSLARVQEAADADLRATRARLDEAAQALVGGAQHPLAEALRKVEEDQARPTELLRQAEGLLPRIAEVLEERDLLKLPAARPRVQEMPPYRWGYAFLWAPGPLENRAGEAVFYIDTVDPGWKDKRRVQEHLRALNLPQLLLTAIHEVLPGHFAQDEARRQHAAGLSAVRQRAHSIAFVEGWAHYGEGLVADRWPGPEQDKLRLLALRQRALRLVRLLAVLRLHAAPQPGGAHFDEAMRLFTEECGMDELAARREAERAACDPLGTMLPALGRMQLERLFLDYKAQEEEEPTRAAFHDAVLAHGELPVVALRRILLTEPGPSL
jgi:uncharacterized protein (DUF885 family)